MIHSKFVLTEKTIMYTTSSIFPLYTFSAYKSGDGYVGCSKIFFQKSFLNYPVNFVMDIEDKIAAQPSYLVSQQAYRFVRIMKNTFADKCVCQGNN